VATANFAKEPRMSEVVQTIRNALFERFGERFDVDPALPGLDEFARISTHRTRPRYLERDLAPGLLCFLCACALSAPSESDLQQADILIVRENDRRMAIADLLPDMPWVREAPVYLVFLANGRRVPKISQMRSKPFANDHLDLCFNATVDAAIVLATFLRAAKAVGLGCCPISTIRDHARAVSELLVLPEKVVPVAGLCVGWPAEEGGISPRLALTTTLHEDRLAEGYLASEIDAYARRRAATRPYRNQRDVARFGRAEFYGWSEDKARQYAVLLRADFGAFVRAQGFRLD
jgi:nitroreductase